MNDINLIITFFAALFAITNPFGNLPFFIAYTRDQSIGVQKATAILLSLFLLVFFFIFFFLGDDILNFFGISIPAFQIAGGIILMLIALGMVNGSHTDNQKTVLHLKDPGINASFEEDIEQAKSFLPKLIVPLGIPIYGGPGAISVVVLYSHEAMKAGSEIYLGSIGVIILSVLIICAVNFVANPIRHLLGDQGLEILVRIMGILLAAMAVGLMIEGAAAICSVITVPV